MADAVGIRPGGIVDRSAVLERVQARARPLQPVLVAAEPAVPAGSRQDPIRRRTAAHLRASLDTAVHASLVVDVDYGAIDVVRRRLGLTYLPFVGRAVVQAVHDFPLVNGIAPDDVLEPSKDVHLGLAVDLAYQGLVVPVVKGAQALRLRALAEAMEERAAAARGGRLQPGDLDGGTLTLTNVGSYGTVTATPIINRPQVAILSVDGIRMRPVAVEADGTWALAVRPVGNLSLSFDHRFFDGAYAAAFLDRVRHELQQRDWEAEA